MHLFLIILGALAFGAFCFFLGAAAFMPRIRFVLSYAVLAGALFLPALAHADTGAASSGLASVALSFLLSHLTAGTVIAVLGFLGAKFLSADRKRQVALAAFHGFHITEDLVAECDKTSKAFPYLTKAEAGLKAADDYMKAQGWRPLKAGEQAAAQLTFKSMNAQANAIADVPGAVSVPPQAPAAA